MKRFCLSAGLLTASLFAGDLFRDDFSRRHYYLFTLTGGKKARLALRLPLEKKYADAGWRELSAADFTYYRKRYYTLKVENEGAKIRA